jgi:hypothetical protein
VTISVHEFFSECLVLKNENESLKKTIHVLNQDAIKLKSVLCELEESQKNFMSVSLIVHAKNENEKMKNELLLLNKRLQYYKERHQRNTDEFSTRVDIIEHVPKDKSTNRDEIATTDKQDEKNYEQDEKEEEVEEQEVEEQEEVEEEEELSVIEFEIEGRLYFISEDDDPNLIFERVPTDEEGEFDVGDEIGSLCNKTNKAIWYK